MRRVEVAVIGGGSAGLIAAREAARRGLEVQLYEEDPVIGRPERCAGLYSSSGLRALGIPVEGRHVQNRVWGAVIYSYGGKRLEVRTREPVALVVSREMMDRLLAEQAAGAGACVESGVRIVSARRDHPYASLSLGGGRGSVEARVLIDAEGRGAFIARQLYSGYRCDGWIPIMQVLLRNHGLERDRVYVWLKHYVREFFCYLVPINEELGRVGVAAYSETLKKTMRFIDETFPGSKILGYSSSSVYTGPPLELGLTGNALLVGDVAGQVKATTGGGVVIGGLCAAKAAEHAAALIRDGVEDLYLREVRPIYRHLRMMHRIAGWLKRLRSDQIDRLIEAAAESGWDRALSDVGEMDFQAAGVLRALLSRSGIKFALSALPVLLRR